MNFSFAGPRFWLFGIALSSSVIFGLGCDQNAPKKNKESPAPARATAPTPPAPPAPPKPEDDVGSTDVSGRPKQDSGPSSQSGAGGSWSLGPGIDGCASQGKVWIAVGPDGGPGVCGDKEAQLCCREKDLVERFKAVSQLPREFQRLADMGVKLYQCSTNGSDQTTFHFAGIKNGSIQYQYLSVNQSTPDGAPPANCPRPSAADLGFSSSPSGGSGSGTGTGTGTAMGSTP